MALMDQIKLVDSSTTEDEGLLAADPVPDTKPTTRRKPGPKPGTRKPAPARARSASAMAKEVADDLTTMFELGAAMWGVRDQCCAPVFEEQARPIATSMAAILERNPRLLAKFADLDNAALIMQLFALGKALAPVVTTVYRNHGPGAGARAGAADGVDSDPAPNGAPAVNLHEFPVFSGVARAQRP